MARPALSLVVLFLCSGIRLALPVDPSLPLGAWPAEQSRGTARLPEKLHDVVSRRRLAPPLRADATVRFSPDGRYFLVQDPQGVFLLSRDPFRQVTYIEVAYSFGAFFSADSQSLRVVTLDLHVGTWSVVDGRQVSSLDLPLKDGCSSARTSPELGLFACFRPSGALDIFRLSDGQPVYAESNRGDAAHGNVMLPLDHKTPAAGPIGYLMTSTPASVVDNSQARPPLFFSPEGNDLIASQYGLHVRLDLATKKKSNLHGDIAKHIDHALLRLDASRLLVSDPERNAALAIRSVDRGEVLQTIPASADLASRASNPRYLLLHTENEPGTRVFDLERGCAVDVPANIGLDIFGPDLALLSAAGDFLVYRLGEKLPYLAEQLPLPTLPMLESAAVDPALASFLFTTAQKGCWFSLADGKQSLVPPRLRGAFFAPSGFSFIRVQPAGNKSPAELSRFDLASRQSARLASAREEELYSAGVVVVGYAFDRMAQNAITVNRDGHIPFRLRAFDPLSGAELWKRTFAEQVPIPFPDPQGSRIVLGWRATDTAARKVSERNPVANEALRKAKLGTNDSFFEVLDARTGKSLGGALVQLGAGAETFDAVFSEGDTLILLKDGVRLSLYSISTGAQIARYTGNAPAASGPAKLLALSGGKGTLLLQDLDTGRRLDEQILPDEIAYMHFSVDGTKLFLLTQHQWAIILDVSRIPRSVVPVSK